MPEWFVMSVIFFTGFWLGFIAAAMLAVAGMDKR